MTQPTETPAWLSLMDALAWAKAVILGLIAICMSLLAWTVNKHVKRLENLESTVAREKDLLQLRADMEARHEERKAELSQLRDDMERRHGENSTKLDTIEGGVTRTHARIDDLYRDLMREKGP